MIISVPSTMQSSYPANELLKRALPLFNGKGGGNKNFAQAHGTIIEPLKLIKGLEVV